MCIREERLKYLFKVRDNLKSLLDLDYQTYVFKHAYESVLQEIEYFTPECDVVKQEGRY